MLSSIKLYFAIKLLQNMKFVLYILLVAHVSVTTASCFYGILGAESEFLELVNTEDSESEEEEELQEEKDDKLHNDLLAQNFDDLQTKISLFQSLQLHPLHHPEIFTPPPKNFISYS